MRLNLFASLLLACLCIASVQAGDVRFSDMVIGGHVAVMNITVDYKNASIQDFEPYPSCSTKNNSDDCPDLNYDDKSEIQVSFTVPPLADLEAVALRQEGKDRLGAPVQFKVMACFEDGYTKRRKWRKPKDVIQDDKRCSKKIVGKTVIEEGVNTVTHKIKSNSPGAHFFVTVFIFCQVEDKDKNQYCVFDTTGPLSSLVKAKDINKRKNVLNMPDINAEELIADTPTSPLLEYRTSVVDSRPTGLVVGVVILSCCSVAMLFGYFTFERLLKKSN